MEIIESKEYLDSLNNVIKYIDLSQLENKKFLITGATGMIGSCIVDLLLLLNKMGIKVKIIAASRNKENLFKRFGYFNSKSFFSPIELNVNNSLQINEQVDFIIHAASNADPANFAQYPVETLLSNIIGTRNLLDYGIKNKMKRFLFVSSGEFYGQPDEHLSDFIESYCGKINHSDFRACYPIGKRGAEVLCQSYISEYNIDAVIVRPCHIFGPTMLKTDSRALSEFIQKSIKKEDIILKSAGNMERSHCYVVDCVGAILTVLLKGACGEAYNISDEKYQMTIRAFAERIRDITNGSIIFSNPTDIEEKGYSKISRAVLDNKKLLGLGWTPLKNDGIKETIEILSECMED